MRDGLTITVVNCKVNFLHREVFILLLYSILVECKYHNWNITRMSEIRPRTPECRLISRKNRLRLSLRYAAISMVTDTLISKCIQYHSWMDAPACNRKSFYHAKVEIWLEGYRIVNHCAKIFAHMKLLHSITDNIARDQKFQY